MPMVGNSALYEIVKVECARFRMGQLSFDLLHPDISRYVFPDNELINQWYGGELVAEPGHDIIGDNTST